MIEAEAEIAKAELFERARGRLEIQEMRRQANLEKIIRIGIENLPEDFEFKDVSPDWLARFADESKDISEDDMQSYWGKILAGELDEPGSTSKRMLSFMRNLSSSEALVIEQLASKVWEVELGQGLRKKLLQVVIQHSWKLGTEIEQENAYYEDWKTEAQLLQDCGFLHTEDFSFHFSGSGYFDPEKLELSRSSAKSLTFANALITPTPKQPNFVRTKGPSFSKGKLLINKWMRTIEFDAWRLSAEGEQLLRVIDPKPSMEHFEEIMKAIRKCGLCFSQVDPAAFKKTEE